MAYNGKTNWQLNEIVKPEDMNRIEQGIIDANKSLLIHNASADAHKNQFDEFVKGVTGSNATLTITKGNGTTSTVTVNNVANATNATNATKATQDSTGQQINSTYIKGLSVSGKTITYTKGNNTTGTITTQDTVYTHPNSGVSAGTYKSVTVNAQGHVTAGSNPTTLSGYGITDAPTKTGGGASGTWGIDISGNAASATNADKVDGIHAASLFYDKGNWDENNWATVGAYQVQGNPPVSGAYGWGQVISSSTRNFRFQLYMSHSYGGNGRLYYRTGYNDDKQPWNTILDSENYNLFTPTKTGDGASGTWGISISGNAASATKATQDSAGQQINTTYIKGLSISGNTITYTKGNGGTSSITVPTGAGAKSYIVESKYNSDGSWYRKWSDGWLEQGLLVSGSVGFGYTFTYPKAFTSKVYGIFLGELSQSAYDTNVCFYDVSLTNAKINYLNPNNLKNYVFICGK